MLKSVACRSASAGFQLGGLAVPRARALGVCQRNGGTLALVSNAAQAASLGALLRAVNYRSVFIGANDILTEGTFVAAAGAALPFTNFAPGEPNNVNNEDCVEAFQDGRWNDISCDSSITFACT